MQSIFENITKPLVIAEAGVNYRGGGSINEQLDRAIELIAQAKKAGADAIKFQTYTADELVVKGTPKFWDWEGDKKWETQYDAYKALGGLDYPFYKHLFYYAEKVGIECFSTPFSIEAADKLNDMGMKSFKIASSDMSTIPLIKHIARFQKPILLSTGASTLEEIHEAVKAIEEEDNTKIIILHCTLCYPTKPEDANFNLIKTLKDTFPDYVVGLSDHTLGVDPSILAVSLGAMVIEKHFTTDKTLPDSADHWLSVDPIELSKITEAFKGWPDVEFQFTYDIEPYMGSKEKKVFDCEKETRIWDKRSIVSKVDIPKDTVITEDMLTFKRPGTGIWPNQIKWKKT